MVIRYLFLCGSLIAMWKYLGLGVRKVEGKKNIYSSSCHSVNSVIYSYIFLLGGRWGTILRCQHQGHKGFSQRLSGAGRGKWKNGCATDAFIRRIHQEAGSLSGIHVYGILILQCPPSPGWVSTQSLNLALNVIPLPLRVLGLQLCAIMPGVTAPSHDFPLTFIHSHGRVSLLGQQSHCVRV